VITGDVTQIDLPSARRSGLLEAVEVLRRVEGLTFVYFDEADVVRHHLVQRIIRAYDQHKTKVAVEQPPSESRGSTNGKLNGAGKPLDAAADDKPSPAAAPGELPAEEQSG
jgi:phosphate starvation-inducible PhoH-like protein